MINRVVLVGRLTRDVEVTKKQSGISLARFTVAVNRRYNRDQTDFINCVAWIQTADFLGQYAKKGALVSVEGSIQTSSYDNPTTGQKVYRTEVSVDNASLEESRNSSYYPDNNDMDDLSAGPVLDISSDDLPF